MRVTSFIFSMRAVVAWVLACALSAACASVADAADRDTAGDRIRVRSILVAASNEAGAPDPKLAPYAATLKRILRFERFRHVGEGAAQVPLPGEGRMPLAAGQKIEIEAADYGEGRYWVRVRWYEGDHELMNTIAVLRKNVPAVFGGQKRSERGETYAVLVVVE